MLFLDEPTIGLDVTMQKRIRTFVADYNARRGATVLLTSHYMADVEALCKRVIVIHHGRILFDGALSALTARIQRDQDDRRRAGRRHDRPLALWRSGWHRRRQGQPARQSLRRAKVTTRLLADLDVLDLTIEDPPIEDVIESVFAVGADDREPAGASA